MSEQKQLNETELEKVTGGTADGALENKEDEFFFLEFLAV